MIIRIGASSPKRFTSGPFEEFFPFFPITEMFRFKCTLVIFVTSNYSFLIIWLLIMDKDFFVVKNMS